MIYSYGVRHIHTSITPTSDMETLDGQMTPNKYKFVRVSDFILLAPQLLSPSRIVLAHWGWNTVVESFTTGKIAPYEYKHEEVRQLWSEPGGEPWEEWVGVAFAEHSLPILTICIIALSAEASSAKHLMNVDCIRNKRKMIECYCWCLRRYVVFICVTAKKITALRLGVCHDHAWSKNTDFQQVILLDEPCSAPGHLPALSSTSAPFKKLCMF